MKSYFESNRTTDDSIKSFVNYTITEMETMAMDADVEYKYDMIVL
jgi:hypothetical protein